MEGYSGGERGREAQEKRLTSFDAETSPPSLGSCSAARAAASMRANTTCTPPLDAEREKTHVHQKEAKREMAAAKRIFCYRWQIRLFSRHRAR